MGNEIKVNEFVRTKDGQIYKIEDGTEFHEDSVNVGLGIIPDVDGIWVDKEHFTYVDKRDIVKHSPELLDLIKAEDVIKIKTGLYSSFMHFVVDEDDLIYIKAQMEAGFWIIDKIYTKEMMESISYKVTKM